MANSTVAALTAASEPDGTELLYTIQGGADRKVTGEKYVSPTRSITATTSTQNAGRKFTGNIAYSANWNNGIASGDWKVITISGSGQQQGSSHTLGVLEEVIEQTSSNQLLTYGRQITLRYNTNGKTTAQAIVTASKLDNAHASSIITQAIHFQALVQSQLGVLTQDIGFQYPDMSAFTIGTKWAFLGQDANAPIQNAGPFIGAHGANLSPAYHGGYAANRYYHLGMPYNNGTLAMTAGNAYGVPFLISERATFTKIGCRLTAAAAAGKLIKFSAFKVANGVAGARVIDTGTIAADTIATPDKEATINVTLEPGPYVAFLQTDGAPTAQTATDFSGHTRSFWGSASSTSVGGLARLVGVNVTSVADNPGSFDVLDGVDVFPDIWLRK